MRTSAGKVPRARRKFFFATAGVMVLTALAAAGVLTAAVWAQAPTAQSLAVPQWQIDAGGKMAFDVTSVKQNKCGLPPSCPIDSNINLLPGDNYSPTGGLSTFVEALKDQLGLKLESKTGPVDVLVIDHIEELSAN